MRVLALDIGAKRIGVAVSDPGGSIAQTVGVITRRTWWQTLDAIRARVAAYHAERVVIGLPLRMDGSEGDAAVGVRRFADRLREVMTVPVDLQDERLSTVEADRLLVAGGARRNRRRTTRDAVAAALFLQTYLDRHR